MAAQFMACRCLVSQFMAYTCRCLASQFMAYRCLASQFMAYRCLASQFLECRRLASLFIACWWLNSCLVCCSLSQSPHPFIWYSLKLWKTKSYVFQIQMNLHFWSDVSSLINIIFMWLKYLNLTKKQILWWHGIQLDIYSLSVCSYRDQYL